MKLFCLYCLDNKENGAALRAGNRPAHLEWAGSLGARLAMAGPLLGPAGEMIGSLIIVSAPDLEAARALHRDDPYFRAGVFADVQINEVRWVIGDGKPA